MHKISNKINHSLLRLKHIVQWFPQRVLRLFRHVQCFCWSRAIWYVEISYLILDCFGIPDFYEILCLWVKWNSRSLTIYERKLLEPIFGNSIDYDRVLIDETAFLGPPQMQICYVSFYTINSWGAMSAALLIHEMVHVWQYQKLGSVYIPQALRAQYSEMGYNYGGAPQVANLARKGFMLKDFNLEQQADLIADYWRIQQGLHPQWGPAGPADLPNFAYFAHQLHA